MRNVFKFSAAVVSVVLLFSMVAFAENDDHGNGNGSACNGLPSWSKLKAALDAAVGAETSGLNLHMWATVVNRDGIVCAIAFSGVDRGAQWPGSRVISAQKANTANSFSLDSTSSISGSGTAFSPLSSPAGMALSTANLYAAVQPGGSLFGLQESNPVDTSVAYKGPSVNYGRSNDPMVGEKIGGVNVFGGGLALYASGKKLIGAVGLSGDTSCADHFIAWRVRNNLELDHMAGLFPVSGDAARPDNIVFDLTNAFGHPNCLFFNPNTASLPAVRN